MYLSHGSAGAFCLAIGLNKREPSLGVVQDGHETALALLKRGSSTTLTA